MYCSKCGKLIEDESLFCNGCGSPVGGQAIANNNSYQTIVDSAANSRLKAMAEINRMIEYYSPKQQQYDELDVCRDKLKFYNDCKSYFVVKGVSSTSVFWALGIISFARLMTCRPGYRQSYSAAMTSVGAWHLRISLPSTSVGIPVLTLE